MLSVILTAHFDGFAKPRSALTISIVTLLFASFFCIIVHADSVLHVVFPLANVLVTVGEHHCALPLLLTGLEVPFVHATVLEG